MNRITPNKDSSPTKDLQSERDHLLSNLKLNQGVENVLRLLTASRIDGKDIDDLDLERKTEDGDTLLHRIVYATVEHPEDMELYMQLVDNIAAKSISWWCRKKNILPSDDHHRQKCKRDAMKYLLSEVTDTKKKNVWELAVEVVSVELIRKLLFLEGITCRKHRNTMHFDMNQFALDKSVSHQDCFNKALDLYCNENLNRRESLLAELLRNAKQKHSIAGILNIKPVNRLVEMYCSFTTKLYILVVFLHVLYMSVFSYAGCELMDSKTPHTSVTIKGLLYGFGLTEPILICFYLMFELPKGLFTMCISSPKVNKRTYIKHFCLRFLTLLVYLVLVCEVISRVDKEIRTIDRNVLSVCLLMGWLLTFALADGIRPIHFFFRLVIEIMITDVLKVLLVYAIFVTGFSLSLHAQFISTANITSTYQTPVHTMFLMFNVMMGMEEAVSGSTEEYLQASGASVLLCKILYIVYLLCCAIVLINLLIAMMNTSYSKIRDQHSAEWICETALVGIKTAEFFPVMSRRLGVKDYQFGSMFKRRSDTEKGLFLILKEDELKEDVSLLETTSDSAMDLQHVDDDIKLSEIRLRNQITETQKKMMECIKELQTQICQLQSELHMKLDHVPQNDLRLG